MGVHKDYPAGTEPTAGPFEIADITDSCGYEVSAHHGLIDVTDTDIFNRQSLSPTQARELAAALIECADHIDRASMTTEDIARETRNRC